MYGQKFMYEHELRMLIGSLAVAMMVPESWSSLLLWV